MLRKQDEKLVIEITAEEARRFLTSQGHNLSIFSDDDYLILG